MSQNRWVRGCDPPSEVLAHNQTYIFQQLTEDPLSPESPLHQQSGTCIFLHMLHINFMLTYLAYFCLFCAYECIWMQRRNPYGSLHIFAYLCIFYAYLCIFKFAYNGIIFMHVWFCIFVHIYAYLCIWFFCIYVHIYAYLCIFMLIMHVYCIFLVCLIVYISAYFKLSKGLWPFDSLIELLLPVFCPLLPTDW